MLKYEVKSDVFKIEGRNLFGIIVEVNNVDEKEKFEVEFHFNNEKDAIEMVEIINNDNIIGFHY